MDRITGSDFSALQSLAGVIQREGHREEIMVGLAAR